MPWQNETLKDDAWFLLRVTVEAQNEWSLRQLPYEINADIVIPSLKQFAVLMKSKAVTRKDSGTLNLSFDEVTYTYKKEIYRLYSHPDQLVKAILAGETVKKNYEKDYDKKINEADFCMILTSAIDNGREDMALFYAVKISKGKI